MSRSGARVAPFRLNIQVTCAISIYPNDSSKCDGKGGETKDGKEIVFVVRYYAFRFDSNVCRVRQR